MQMQDVDAFRNETGKVEARASKIPWSQLNHRAFRDLRAGGRQQRDLVP